ncbi:putative membrane protein [Anaplasma phagocytophilum str. ApMUC09]|uniref:Putative membrane protein n=1 Tax=Anaplasma phagocytophilum str. ApMUC09 TaxID=1359152 RepID=A0A0F3N8K7_ANAPH|nr:putative membrane protein [Anaplasma phagocytophilum str. ApMUC09]
MPNAEIIKLILNLEYTYACAMCYVLCAMCYVLCAMCYVLIDTP